MIEILNEAKVIKSGDIVRYGYGEDDGSDLYKVVAVIPRHSIFLNNAKTYDIRNLRTGNMLYVESESAHLVGPISDLEAIVAEAVYGS